MCIRDSPDLVVDVGEKREMCAGAIASMYEKMGGKVIYFGKPHNNCLLYTSPSPRDVEESRMPSSA